MHCTHTPNVYLCAFAHYTGGTLAIGREDRTLTVPSRPRTSTNSTRNSRNGASSRPW